MTEIGPNLAEFRATLRAKLASMPPVGTQGREIKTSAQQTEAAVPEAMTPEPVNPGMKPNPAQGAGTGRAPIATGTTSGATSFERVRNISHDIARLDFDPTLT
jgi:hypothetical protein